MHVFLTNQWTKVINCDFEAEKITLSALRFSDIPLETQLITSSVSLTKCRIDTNYIKFFRWKMTLVKLEAIAFPRRKKKIKAKSTESDLGDYLTRPINFCMWSYSDREYKKGYS